MQYKNLRIKPVGHGLVLFDGWLPTLDTGVQVSENNTILFRFYEKPTNSNRALDKRTALGENQKVTILTQEVIRRLGNTTKGWM